MDAYDIIIQGGQSNAEGFGIGAVKQAYIPSDEIVYLNVEKTEVAVDDRIQVTYLDKPFRIEKARERLRADGQLLGDFSLTFAKRYVENGFLEKGRKILVVRAAIGGTGFQKGHWGIRAPLYKKMLEMTDYALSLNSANKAVAFLWHQGEHDAVEGNLGENYYKQLLGTVTSVRKRYGDIPFIAGDFVHEWKNKNLEICVPIVNAIKKISETIGNAALVETADLLSNNQKTGNGDDIHFCRESLYLLGEQYFEQYKNLQNKTV
ncbi:MAG: hypothetical protein IJB97_08890 [Clostridia bacterium]|nr:hypothetical protein [Clostridia bacterium]